MKGTEMIGLNGNSGFMRANLLKPMIKEEEIEPKGAEPSPVTESVPETKPTPEEDGAVVKIDSSKMKMLLANFAINIGEFGNKGDAKADGKVKQYQFAGYETAEEARKAYNLPKDTFEQFFEVNERDDGRFIVEPKPPYSSCSFETKECNTGTMGYNLDADGNMIDVTPVKGEYTTYTLTSYDGSGSVKITYGANTINGPVIEYLDANGKPLDLDATFRGSSIDTSVIEGYGDGKYDSVELHERGKGKSGSVEKMEDKATELLNTKDFKSQVLAQYKAMCAARGETFNEKAFEALYQKAIDTTLQEDGVITSRGARGLSSKGHAWCNTWTLVNTFLSNFDKITKSNVE